MKNRPRDKKAGIIILAILFVLSVVDVILRASTLKNIASTAANHGEVFMTAALSLLLIIFALKGKDRVFHILCGVWLGYFVLEQLFRLPYIISSFFTVWGLFASIVPVVALLLRLAGMICVIAIGALLVEYMNDGTIYIKAFNGFCVAAVLVFIGSICIDIHAYTVGGEVSIILSALNSLSSIVMVFLFSFFAYDGAKARLKK